MARGYVVISGKLGDTIAYYDKTSNRLLYRSRPSKYQQTKGTLASQKNFSKASSAGRVLRKGLVSVLPFLKDKSMQGKFSGAINKWMGITPFKDIQPTTNIAALKEFQFNVEAELSSRWKVELRVERNVDGELQLRIPAFIPTQKISAPAGTVLVECRIAAAGCMLEKAEEAGQFSTTYEFDLDDVEQQEKIVPLGLNPLPGTLIVCGVMLLYRVKGKGGNDVTKNIKFIPAGVVGGSYW